MIPKNPIRPLGPAQRPGKEAGMETVTGFVTETVRAMETGALTYRGENYSRRGIDNWLSFRRVWGRFEQGERIRPIRFEEIDLAMYGAFMTFLDRCGYRKSSKHLYASLLKAVLNSAYRSGASANTVHFSREFTDAARREIRKVYLTEEEIESLRRLPLPTDGQESRVRDLFLLGCYTGQRFSDYATLCIDDLLEIRCAAGSGKAFYKRQRKTGHLILIPVLHDCVMEILERWGGCAPQVSISCLNKRIKALCRDAEITAPVRISEQIGGRSTFRTKPKCELVSSHTARRSFITNLYLQGRLSPEQIRAISGHCTETAFRSYLCLSSEEMVRSILDDWR